MTILLLLTVLSGTTAAADDIKVPERGFISSKPGETWEQGLIAANGTLGASVLGRC